MSGNVCEWCSDLYGSYSSLEQTNPTGLESSYYCVIRGGSWNDETPANYRVSYRKRCMPQILQYISRIALSVHVQ